MGKSFWYLKGKAFRLAMVVSLAAAPLLVISTATIPGCTRKICLPDCSIFSAGLLAIFLLRGDGQNGISCWDLNGNGVCDLATEDANGDGVCNALDCQGPPGESAQPIPGVDGLNCWDLNANGTCDLATEDINGDGLCDALDCQGPAGPPGQDGSDGRNGTNGQDGPPGPAGPTLFDLFIEDFFTYGAISDAVSGQAEVINIQEPVLSRETESFGPIGFRVSVPEIYTQGDPVTLRLFLWRDATESSSNCTTLRLDTFRMIPGGGIARYGTPLWLRLEPDGMTDPGMLVVDLPLNTPAPGGLGFPNDLFAPQMLAFEISVFRVNESMDLDADYTVLGAEAFESASAADTAISGVTVFTSDADVISFCAPD